MIYKLYENIWQMKAHDILRINYTKGHYISVWSYTNFIKNADINLQSLR